LGAAVNHHSIAASRHHRDHHELLLRFQNEIRG